MFMVVRESVEHRKLSCGIEQKLLIMLAVDIAEMRSEVLQQGYSSRPVIDVDATLAAREDFALEYQFGIFALDTCVGKCGESTGARLKDRRYPSAVRAGANHVRRSAAAEKQGQS